MKLFRRSSLSLGKKKRRSKDEDGSAGSSSLNSYKLYDPTTGAFHVPGRFKKSDDIACCSVDQIPALIQEINQASSSDSAYLALRKLFALSEHASEEVRCEMVAETTVVPCLLRYLERCLEETAKTVSRQQQQPQLILALMILNNISIPVQNKRTIAIECRGVDVLSKLICKEPSYGLLSIILVNLTFSNASLRRDIVSRKEVPVLQALAFAFRVATMTKDEYKNLKHLIEEGSPTEKLSRLVSLDGNKVLPPPPKAHQIFPDTARRCLCAIQNLTRPSTKNPAPQLLAETGVVNHILRFIVVPYKQGVDTSFSSLSSNETPTPAEPENHPFGWGDQSCKETEQTTQDNAVFVIFNLALDTNSRKLLVKTKEASDLLNNLASCTIAGLPYGAQQVLNLQRLKARMALAFLHGAEGYFGQPGPRRLDKDPFADTLQVEKDDVDCYREVLSCTLHRRSKESPGGFRAVTFTVKSLLFALYCLLTQPDNQLQFAQHSGHKLNALLLKALGMHSLQKSSFVDVEAAEYACFSLYILSQFGFHVSCHSCSI